MGSVVVKWSGQCANLQAQQDLTRRLEELAELSHSYFDVPPPIKVFDHPIEGNVIMSGALRDVDGADSRLVKVRKRPAETASATGDFSAVELRLAGPLQPKRIRVDEDLFRVDKIKLYGIEFRLYDGRQLYPDDDRVSFAFLRVDDCPELDGRIVYVEDHEQCQYADHEIVRSADWYLTTPHIHLRYYCEEWLDILLGLVKYFYVPDLDFWRYKYLPGYEELTKVLEETPREDLKEIAFDTLKEQFQQRVEAWRETAKQAAEFWSAALHSAGKKE